VLRYRNDVLNYRQRFVSRCFPFEKTDIFAMYMLCTINIIDLNRAVSNMSVLYH
jgi:hypothetical protein